jgi:nicotinamide riboside kinase
MRIAITGSHGVGKTTLAKKLAEGLKLPLIEEIARKMADIYGIKHTEEIKNASWGLRAEFQDSVWYAQMVAEDSLREFVSDRSILDVVAYSLYYGLDGYRWRVRRERAPEEVWGTYDLLVYVPIRFPLRSDGFRLTDDQSQKACDKLIRQMFSEVEGEEVCFESGICYKCNPDRRIRFAKLRTVVEVLIREGDKGERQQAD